MIIRANGRKKAILQQCGTVDRSFITNNISNEAMNDNTIRGDLRQKRTRKTHNRTITNTEKIRYRARD